MNLSRRQTTQPADLGFVAGSSVLLIFVLCIGTMGKTPRLNITLKHNSEGEEKRKEQIERLAEQYDLAKYTITRDIVIDQQVEIRKPPNSTE